MRGPPRKARTGASRQNLRPSLGRSPCTILPPYTIGYGSDTDTTAAVAGGLAGALWGIGGIPAEWLSAMRGHEIVEPMVVQLLAAARP